MRSCECPVHRRLPDVPCALPLRAKVGAFEAYGSRQAANQRLSVFARASCALRIVSRALIAVQRLRHDGRRASAVQQQPASRYVWFISKPALLHSDICTDGNVFTCSL